MRLGNKLRWVNFNEPAPAPAPDPGAGDPPPSGGGGGTPAPTPTPEGGTPAPTPAPEPTPPAAVNQFANLGDNWRTDLLTQAGFEGDDLTTRQNQLERVLDMGTFAKNYFSAQDKIRAGELSNGLPADPTPEQLTEWRAANGVPEEAGGYELTLGEGLVLGENDKAILATVFEAGHAHNVNNTAMSNMVGAFLQAREDEAMGLQAQDGVHKNTTEQALRKAWGQDFETNINLIKGLTNQLPEAMRAEFESSRLGNGMALFNSPEFMVFFGDIARKLNPAGRVVPNSANPMETMESEIASLKKLMNETIGIGGPNDWHKNTQAQNRLMELEDARDEMKENQK